ncbi:MAG: SulP family inorganic anion transporter [Muricauda sp.]|nr:SulP family inorganic anion transporter [Allomuricauda sp.]MBO6590075.1 SulP family inorganic anion transporter [Allomuricauda sp.]MBO6619777.1 SulP family inorganic anion transporter [Allomuricauda sp.]MBO6645596.1 SulP family inorganic anion transporter [Allomuricauda sp.]MBO6748115.1 SulP family inorganic anion transporter [Allomuricauda sp.]MBO6845495.1 SulP family inorganic anion transporter [Allomuricauda sp.]
MGKSFFNFKHLKGDFTGGLVAGVVALPLALAFGVQSGMGATAGLYGAIAVGIFAALFGGTETQASGPTGPMTVVSAAVVAFGIQMNGSLDNGMHIILLTFLLAGLFQVVFGFLNIASYVKYFPYPVISGFMSGVGLIIVILQIFPLVGLDSAKSTWAVIQDVPRLFEEANLSALLLGAITIVIYFLFPKITKAIPSALVALIGATLVAYFMKMDVPLIGEIPAGLPAFQLGGILSVDPSYFPKIIEYGLVLAVLGSIDSLLTSVIADNMTKTKHNSNRELIGQGIGNMLAAAIGGIPGAGATKGTVVNINAGGKTRLSGIIHGLFLLTVLLGLGKLTAYIPLCVLAGLLIPIGFKIIDFKGLKHLLKVPRADAVVLFLVLTVTTFGSLIHAVGIGIALACLLFMKKSGDIGEKGLQVERLSDLEDEKPWQDEIEIYEKYKDKIVIKHLYGPLFFGFTSYLKDQVKALPDDIESVILRMDRVPYIDQSGLYTLEDIIFDLRSKNIEVIIVGLKEQPCDMLKAIDIIPDLIPEEDLFKNIDDSFSHLREQFKS